MQDQQPNKNRVDDVDWLTDDEWDSATSELRRILRRFRTPILLIVAFFVAVAIGSTVVGFAGRWVGGTADIVSFDNFEEQHFQLQQDWESLEAAQGNACAAQEVLDAAIARDAPESTISQRESQLLQIEANYRRIGADYDRRMANFFETLDGFVAPPELPDTAPPLAPCS